MMDLLFLPTCIPDTHEVGAKVAYSRTLTECDVALSNEVRGDANPLHTNDVYAHIIPSRAWSFHRNLSTHIGEL